MSVRKSLVAVCGLVLAGGAFAETYTWVYRADVGTSPVNAALWTDPANWDAKGVPDSSDKEATVDMKTATNRYVRIDGDVTTYLMYGCSAGHPVLFGDGKLTITGTGLNKSATTGFAFFVPLTLKDTRTNAHQRFGNCEIAADLTLTQEGISTRDGVIRFRPDWYANDTSASRENLSFAKYRWTIHYSSPAFYGLPALSAPTSSTWKLTKGSPYATRVGAGAHALPPGTTVTCGELLPAGTFLKRIFPDGTIEFSNAALDDSAEGTVTFAAFAPTMRYEVASFDRSVQDTLATISVNAYAGGGAVRVDAKALYASSGTDNVNSEYVITHETGFVAGTFAVHNVASAKYLGLNNGCVEFDGKDAAGTGAGLPSGCLRTNSDSANDVIVTNNITATVGSLRNFQGTLNKKGAGTLALPADLSPMSGSGKVVVQEGVVTFAAPTNGLPLALPGSRFEVAAGATLKLPATGAKISSLPTCAEGATIAGPAILVVADALDASSLPLAGDVQVVKASQYGISSAECTWEAIPAATSPLDADLPVPASWMDASDAASLVTREDADQLSLLTWKDVRGAGYPVANAASESVFAQVVTNAAGKSHHVYIKPESTITLDQTRALVYSPTVPQVKAIFKVFDGCGAFICGQSYKWLRPYPHYDVRLFYNSGSAALVPGTFYVNGAVRAENAGCPYMASAATDKSQFDPEVAEFHFAESGADLPNAINIGYYSGGGDSGRNGRDRICEMILYTNELTFVQRQKICAYLMKKWLHGAEPNVDYGTREVAAFDASEEVPVTVGDGQVMAFQSLTGAGTLRKEGAGDVYVKALETTGGLHVAAGKATVTSTALTRDTLPGDPYLHLDASDAATITSGPTAGTIAAMADVRGAGHPTATVVNAVSGKYPTLVANAQGDLPMVDYGGQIYQGTSKSGLTGLTFPKTENLYSVFRIAGGDGGGVIAGYIGEEVYWTSQGVLHTLSRTEGGISSSYAWLNSAGSYALGQKQGDVPNPGGSEFRLDGVTCNAYTAKHPSMSVQLLAMNGYDHIISDALGCNYGSQSMYKYWGGDCRDGETILYTNALSRASMLKVEAYLNKKWFGKETPGLRPAFVGSLAVDAGATLDIVGGAPVTASSFTSAGTVNGAVALTAGAPIKLVVNDDGSVAPMGVTGGVDFSQGGTVVLTGNVAALKKGIHAVATALGAGFGAWTVSNEGLRANWRCRLVRTGDTVALEAIAPGMLLIVR